MSDPEIPTDHPLHGHENLLDTHAGHLEAYARILEDADPDETTGVMLVLHHDDGGSDTLPSVAPGVDARYVSLWMLGSHLHHIASSGRGMLTMEDVAHHAIHMVRESGIPGEPYDE